MKRRSQATKETPASDLPRVDLRGLAGLHASLSELTALCQTREREVRDHIIAAKDRAKWAAKNQRASEEKRAAKAEMAEWMLVWLDDPAMFATWAQLRLQAMETMKCDVCSATGQCTTCKGTGNGGQCFNCAGTGNCPQCQGTGQRKVKQ